MKFRRAKEMKSPEKRTPVSIRIRENLKQILVAEAKTNSLTLAELIEQTLEDYAEFIQQNKKK